MFQTPQISTWEGEGLEWDEVQGPVIRIRNFNSSPFTYDNKFYASNIDMLGCPWFQYQNWLVTIHDKYESEAVILTTTLCSLHAACASEKAQ